MTLPKKLTVASDQNELEFTRTIETTKDIFYEYRFTKSKTKEGSVVTFTESVLKTLLKNKIFI